MDQRNEQKKKPDNSNMKTLRPTTGNIWGTLVIMAMCGFSIVVGIATMIEGVIIAGLFEILFGLIFGGMGIVGVIRKERGHLIQYGDGKLIIRRRSKLCKRNSTPTGSWEVREDVIPLEDIERYGWSVPVLGRRIEYTPYDYKHVPMEYFIKLKSGRYIGFMPTVYTKKQIEELNRYLLEEAGIEFSFRDKME